MEIEVGEYVRTKEGYIGQVTKVIENKIIEFKTNQIIKVQEINITLKTTIESITKHSKNIIDLIEVRRLRE